ncbi:MAG: hypothetical protein IKI77_09935 [Oscillospiraceae bacterium]|nr:hypothetical protein [Oscillospiraceae bacterium]
MKGETTAILLLAALLLTGCGSDAQPAVQVNTTAPAETAVLAETTVPAETTAAAETTAPAENAALTQEAEDALYAYLRCESYETLADCTLPDIAAEELKTGKLMLTNTFFAGFPCPDCSDVQMLSCAHLSADIAQNAADFLATGIALQGSSAGELSADDGFDVNVDAICRLDEDHIMRVSRHLMLLHLTGEKWIVMPQTGSDDDIWEFVDDPAEPDPQ